MNIVIADDEYLVRYSLKSMISELDLPVSIVGEAENGNECVDIISRKRPDAAIIDIKMPGLTGLECIRVLKECSPQTVWIILTSYSDFEFARTAIKLGVEEYLLKPPRPEELAETLRRVRDKRLQEIQLSNRLFEQSIGNLLVGTDDTALTLAPTERITGFCFDFDSILPNEEQTGLFRDFCCAMRKLLGSFVWSNLRYGFTILWNGSLIVSVMMDPSREAMFPGFFRKISDLLRYNKKKGYFVTGIVSGFHDDVAGYLDELDQISLYRSFRYAGSFAGLSDLHDYRDLFDRLPEGTLTVLRERLDTLGDHLSFSVRLLSEVPEILSDGDPRILSNLEETVNTLFKPMIAFTFSDSLTCSGLQKRVDEYKISVSEQTGKMKTLSEKTMDFIKKHYTEDIGISQIADMLEVTPNYLSCLFKKQTGENLLQYMTDYRLEKARDYLFSPSVGVAEVARKVGYHGYRHFSRKFKEKYGCSPSEFVAESKKSAHPS